jgi:hypothetical protein
MTKQTLYKISVGMVIFGLLFWLAETWYFGFNQNAESTAENICDWVAIFFVLVGFIIKPVNEEMYFNGCTFIEKTKRK